MKISEQLKAAKEIIKEPAAWTQRTCARDKDGVDVGYMNDGAVCFCSFGAILVVTTKEKGECLRVSDYYGAAEMLKRGFGSVYSIGAWNDSHTHTEVIEGFDNAIALAELEGV